MVDTGSFGAAAEATHRSQPWVSMHVAALERESGVALFDRRKRPVLGPGPPSAGVPIVAGGCRNRATYRRRVLSPFMSWGALQGSRNQHDLAFYDQLGATGVGPAHVDVDAAGRQESQ
ncbi:helix-turn-helix domain-containing protein [Streptomyces sp. NPDC001858]